MPKVMNGVGSTLYASLHQWAVEVKASRLIDFMRETDKRSLAFAENRSYVKERYTFESVLDLESFDGGKLYDSIYTAKRTGIRFATLAEEPGDASERKLYDLYKVTLS